MELSNEDFRRYTIETAKSCRFVQAQYLRYKTRGWLIAAKEAERELDRCLSYYTEDGRLTETTDSTNTLTNTNYDDNEG